MANRFQLAIIGSRFPHLALGSLLAKRGKKVLILDQREETGAAGQYSYTFSRRPVPLFGLDSKGLLRRFLDEIGIGQVLVRKSYPANPVSYQVVLPRHRINVYPKRDRYLAELQREFPDSVDIFREVFTEFDTLADDWSQGLEDLEALESLWPNMGQLFHLVQGAMQTRKLEPALARFPAGSAEAQVLALQQHFLGALPLSAEAGMLSASLVHRVGRRGTFREPDGSGSLAALMTTRLTEYGGIVQKAAPVAAVERNQRSSLTLKLADGQKVDTGAVATTEDIAARIKGLELPQVKRHVGAGDRLYPIRFFFGLKQEYVPAGMENNLFMLREDDGGPLSIKALYLSLSPEGSGMAPRGKRALTVTALAERSRLAALTEETISAAGDDILQALLNVIPFLDEGMDHFSHELEAGGAMRMPRPLGGGFIAWSPGTMGRRRISTILKGHGVIMTSSPWELGMEGEALSALAASGALRKVMAKDR